MAILTGESLVNDAAALSLFSFAVAQVAGSKAFISNPLLLFTYSAILGVAVGASLGYITLWIRRRLAHPGLETIQGLVVPFAAFISAEHLHASGVLAVVVAGFVVGHGSLHAGYQTRLQERYVWNSVDVMLEAFVFAYIGLQLRFVLEDLREAHESLTEVALASGVVLVVVLLIRPACVFLMFGRGLLSRHVENRLSVPVPVVGARGTRHPKTQARQVVCPDRPPTADMAGECRRVLTGMRGGDAGGAVGHSPDDYQRAAVPGAGDDTGHRIRGQRRHAVASGLDAAAADPLAWAVI
jgi:CPA1 family monovalent cation:H+ antiporter